MYCSFVAVPTVFYFTIHSGARGNEREITKEQFKLAVSSPDTKSQMCAGSNGGFKYIFTKNIDLKILIVVAEVKKEECWVVTGYWQDNE